MIIKYKKNSHLILKCLLTCFIFLIVSNSLANDTNEKLEDIRGLIKPKTSAMISSELSAQIEKLPYRSGDEFKKGDLLVKFNCALYSAQHASARATLKSKLKTLENLKRLLSLNASSDVDVELAEIDVEKSQAEVRAASVLTQRCMIKAPYGGRVVDTLVNQYESVSDSQELLSIINDKELEIEVIIPSSWLVWIEPELEFEFHVDEIQQTYKAKVINIGATVDPVSQTITIKGAFIEEANVLAGMSGTASFKQHD